MLATNLPTGPGIPTKAELFGGLNARKGNEVSKDDLSADLEALLNTGLFANVDANVTPKGKDGYAVEFVFREKIWPGVQTFKVKGATALPPEIEKEVLTQVRKQSSCTVRVLATMKNIIEGYYTSKGETGPHTTPFAWCTSFLKDFSRRHSSPALPFQRLTGKTFD